MQAASERFPPAKTGNERNDDMSNRYNADAVQQQIDRENSRRGKGYISKREARLIHALLKGRG
jgi:hypothetical protein